MSNNLNLETISFIKQASHSSDEKINSQVCFLYKQEAFKQKVQKLFQQKKLSFELGDYFMNILSKNITNFSDVQNIGYLLDFCLIDEIFDENFIYYKTNLRDCFNKKLSSKNIKFIKKIMPDLIKWSGKMGTKADVGDGERLLQIMTKNISENSGKIEIKGMESRLKGTGEGYNNTTSVSRKFIENLGNLLNNFNLSKIDINNFNFHQKGINYILSLFDNSKISHDIFVKFLTETIISIYDKLNYDDCLKILNKSIVDDNFSTSEFLKRFSQIQFKYYKQLKNFDGILFLNSQNFNIKYISDDESFYNNLNLFNVSCSFSWKQERNNTFQLTLK